jgi:hypothetical protein
MKLSREDIARLMEARFSGNLVYMPIHMTGSFQPRAVAQMTGRPELAGAVMSTEPRSLSRACSGLHVKGILHHLPEPKQGG